MSVIIEFIVVPLGELSLSGYVAEVVKFLENKGVKYTLTPMSTIIEVSSIGEGLGIIEEAHELMFRLGAKRVSTTIRIDDRRDKDRKMEDKVKSVLEKMGEG
ncbi:thiamine-binding protein [Thermococci archaeon]|uniref:MTH1187 family thiamine-binding protein n=1 Tax=Palaeococcus sp. (in: euryarchaeotes) TaxID=2820298 RepID=UPI000F172083|nr:MTH1187 family thiamine-binding protein [Palaeococcus sp. (in: euryarchaeotes)]MCD6559277.1 MTH1187 family thiamine-binding protein [Palaeococcus sp. (in: euryarchaeotes)]RLF78270.1 MAG: thiamine-binding protein [Thermococci archaeon]RLF90542.1 MAG: thiamine-binding protein [Thermococci archaeon]